MPASYATQVDPGTFEPERHWYPKALNATIHPLVHFFLHLEDERIIQRYCHLHPRVKKDDLRKILAYQPKHFFWAGADLMHVTNASGKRQMIVIETNSCPSGQKSMPLLNDNMEQGGYRLLVERTLVPMIQKRKKNRDLNVAVIYDKNLMEASGYAHALADALKRPVHLAAFGAEDPAPPVRLEDGKVYVRNAAGDWLPMDAVFRYLTQRPWNRLPVHSKTLIVNPTIACLAGGRNKMVASKAYNLFNAEIEGSGLEIITPETIWDVSKNEVPLWVRKMGGQAVVKNPYSNAGQGVFTIVNEQELDKFMQMEFRYERFIVQSLIGNYHWSSTTSKGKFYHLGTIPSKLGNSYVTDIRMMVSATETGIRPLAIYARKARSPLKDILDEGIDSWDILGTNLSLKLDDGGWDSDTNRLLLMDRRDFNKLGIGLDDLIDAYLQTVLSVIAIDKMAQNLINSKGKFKAKLFQSLDDDPALLTEILAQ
ncbi:MAG: hypothetical protein NWR67_07445 [Saprospiraceae bacterium]|nr:hypothetical protein [Saprospiraceae bacterium]